MAKKQSRVNVSLEDFLRVTVHERDKYPTKAEAAKALGMTEGSFAQRLTKERKEYPTVFEGVPRYRGTSGPRRATEKEALEILARLRNESAPSEEGDSK